MKKTNIFLVILFLMTLGFSCTDESKYPVPFDTVNNANGGILKVISQTSVILTSNIAASKYEVEFEANDRDRGKLFDKVELFVQFVDQTPLTGPGNKAEVLIETYTPGQFAADPITGLPRIKMTKTATETMTALGLTLPDIVNGRDQFIFRQAMHIAGRVFSVSNVTTPIAASGGVYKSPFQNIVNINVCDSELAGDIDYVTVVTAAVVPIAPCLPSVSGTTTLTKTTHGEYALGDATFGQYDCAWGDKPASGVSWVDFCNSLTSIGGDQYSLVYTFSGTVGGDGSVFVVDWFNDYGDFGTSTLTRADGSKWPVGLSF